MALQLFSSQLSNAWDNKDTGLVVGGVLGGPIGFGVAAIYNNNSSNNTTALSYACLSIDGAPISNDTPLAEKCCASGSLKSPPPAECKVGFYGTGPNAVGDGMGAFQLAQNLMENQAVMGGASTDLQQNGSRPDGTNLPGSKSSALVSGGDNGFGGMGSSKSLTDGSGLGSQGSGSGGGGGGGAFGGAGAGGGSGFLSAKRGKKVNANGMEEPSFAGGMYASKGGPNDRATPGATGPDKVTPTDSGIEMIDAGGSQGAGAGAGAAGANGASGDLLTGSREDAVDYLNRIDRNLSIFKVVSKRYEREITRNRVQEVEIK